MGSKRRRHTPEQVIRKLREADRLLEEGQEVAVERIRSRAEMWVWPSTWLMATLRARLRGEVSVGEEAATPAVVPDRAGCGID
jgi:hypothetical protein